MTPELISNWRSHLYLVGSQMTDDQAEACARLAIVLLCGEQSAVQVFSAEVERGNAPSCALSALRVIENDETLHERALRIFCEYLPTPNDAHILKRRAQRFFLALGRTNSLAHQFDRISHLDSAVCRIMWHVENSSANKLSPLHRIASAIKTDEARHVAVTRRYARALGVGAETRNDNAQIITTGLVEMLEPLGDSFENIGVDCDRLFSQIRSVDVR